MNQWRRRAIRVAAAYGFIPAALCGVYTAATWDSPNRGQMLVVILIMLVVALGGWLTANRLGASRWWRLPLWASVLTNLAGDAALGLFDGGVAGPLGTLLPATVVFLAIVLQPPVFLVFWLLSAISYGVVAVFGATPPAGYPLVHTLAYGAAALLCLRHSMVLASLRRRLAHTSRTDPLTGCLNRRGFDERLAAEIAAGRPATLVLLDLDHFKNVNDAHGHQAGDDLLAWAGLQLRSFVRADGAAGRLGGDEFALLLPGSGVDAAELRARLASAAPASVGFAVYPDDAPDPAGLALVADQRLYCDKSSRIRQVPTAEQVAVARTEIAHQPVVTVADGERRRHSIADPGWMALSQTVIALIYITFFGGGHEHRTAMVAICVWGFTAGFAVVAGADWLSRSRLARPLMLAYAASAFLSCAAIAALDGGVSGPLGVGVLLSIPLLMLGMRPAVAAPVAVVAGGLYVVLAMLVGDPDPWYVAINLLGTAATSVACALQGRSAAAQRRMLTRMARVDVLTGVLNRRGFAERFEVSAGAGLLVIDLDGFKQLNDAHGHAAGDELLRWVADRISAFGGVTGRLGGDEFVVLVSGDAFTVAARVQEALAERTAASIGVAVAGRDGDDFDTLYAIADERLYQQKGARKAQALTGS
jgi:diguanylate cyclase (GGDEF)-like protein